MAQGKNFAYLGKQHLLYTKEIINQVLGTVKNNRQLKRDYLTLMSGPVTLETVLKA